MNTLEFLAEWALRSSILILSGAFLLWAMRIKDSSVRLAAWTAVLCASMVIPVLTAALPGMPFVVARVARPSIKPGNAIRQATPTRAAPLGGDLARASSAGIPERFDWARAAIMTWGLVALALLLRLCLGLVMSLRLRRGSRETGESMDGLEIRVSDRVTAPVTLGIVRPAIVLPSDWREWSQEKLDAVLAHERSHIRRRDPAVQLLSAIHRALLWHSPASWFLHKRIVRVAEEASDDAAVAATRDRALYAEVLLSFLQRGMQSSNSPGIPMARYESPERRIHRILDETTVLSSGITRRSTAAILVFGTPLVWATAAARPEMAPAAQTQEHKPAAARAESMVPRMIAQAGGRSGGPSLREPSPPAYQYGLGIVTAFYTVTIKPRVDGELVSVGVRGGEKVTQGQLLATIDSRAYQIQVAQAEGQLAQDRAQLALARQTQNASAIAQLEGKTRADQAGVDSANLLLSYTQIHSPIRGVVGLNVVDPGNIVRVSDAAGIMVITQMQPIAVLFTMPEDRLPVVRARLKEHPSLPVEAWNRTDTAKIATGMLVGVDNMIDQDTGTIKLKAVFNNDDGALYPNQFVNVHLLLSGR